jgi:hypothetical protein
MKPRVAHQANADAVSWMWIPIPLPKRLAVPKIVGHETWARVRKLALAVPTIQCTSATVPIQRR